MGGIEWNTVHTIGGRSGSGKTAILNQLETELGFLNDDVDFEILSFNFEMLARNLVGRKFASKLNKTTKELYSGKVGEFLGDSDYEKVLKVGKDISQLKVTYVEHSGTVEQIETTIHNFYANLYAKNPENGLIVLLDHTILVRGKRGEMERLVLAELMTMFNRLKKLYKISFVVLTQLNREIESSDRMANPHAHFPLRKDIFGGDMVYQFSDVVMVSMNPEQMGLQSYGPHSWPVEGYVYWHFIKVREGEPCIAQMKNMLKYSRIEEDFTPLEAKSPGESMYDTNSI
jgi:replicative DNA helicase